MNVTISAWHESETCTWCQKNGEAVTVTFDSGFLRDSSLCWKCLQQAVRVHHTQHGEPKKKPDGARATAS